ncbi:MAG: hypothetical protein JSS69_17000 [Acidobacteria bacterium]|nr:hypothetical protein [Acidobacteriota bacterium]MBS1867614.1 hypothetical protein [Acidobacteriota bacterium]
MSNQQKRIAVIAIHGVGHHESGATAQAVTDLLGGVEMDSSRSGRNRYTPFSLQQVQIALPPSSPRVAKASLNLFSWKQLRYLFEERRGVFRDLYTWTSWFGRKGESKEHVLERHASDRKIDIATEFMQVQLAEFAGDKSKNTFTTWRHSGRRLGEGNEAKKDVDVFEMYWADLARPNNSFVRFLFSFYQLLLHLVSLGRIALDQACLEHAGKLDWFIYLRSYTYASRVLTLGVLPLLVLLYGVALAPLPLLLPVGFTRAAVGGGVVVLAGLAILLFYSLKRRPFPGTSSWWFWLIPSVIPGVALGWFLARNQVSAPAVLVVEWWIAGAGVSYWIFAQYDLVRNGAKQAGEVFIGLVTVAFVFLLWSRHSFDEVALKTTSSLLVQGEFLVLRFFVLLFVLLTVFSFLMELFCRARLALQPDSMALSARARAAAQTSRFAMAIPALLILLLAVFTGSAAYRFANAHTLYSGALAETIPPPLGIAQTVLSAADSRKLLDRVEEDRRRSQESGKGAKTAVEPAQSRTGHSVHAVLQGLIIQSAPPGMIVTISLAAIGFLALGLIVLPSVYFEKFPPRIAKNLPARLLGGWLSSGFRHFRWTVALLWSAVFLVPVITLVVAIWMYTRPDAPHEPFLLYFYSLPLMAKGEAQLLTLGGVIAGSAVVLAGILVKYLSSVLDTILDVDTYLRTGPPDATPRAMIAERYASLLRHIHACRGENGIPAYDHIVIVAHSLGSLITADLMRFLHQNRMSGWTEYAFDEPVCRPLPVYFFSMGCPLRQLLNRFFPHLYGWVRPVPEDTGVPFPASEPGTPIEPATAPQPSDLGMKQWVNFYRSGDYVGRSIWTNHILGRTGGGDEEGAYPNPATPTIYFEAATAETSERVDACIGLGSHTHYWDRTAPDVGNQLDALIAS